MIYYHLAVLSIIMSLLPATRRFLVTDSYLIFLLLVAFLRLRGAFAALLGPYGQSTLEMLGKLKSWHIHRLQPLFLAWKLTFTHLFTTTRI